MTASEQAPCSVCGSVGCHAGKHPESYSEYRSTPGVRSQGHTPIRDTVGQKDVTTLVCSDVLLRYPEASLYAQMVVRDLIDRNEIGVRTYGTPLQTHNGRDAILDAYQEGLDMSKYLRQALAEDLDWSDADDSFAGLPEVYTSLLDSLYALRRALASRAT